MARTLCMYIMTVIAMGFSEIAESPEPILQRTISALFTLSPETIFYPGNCQWLTMSKQQRRLCRRDPGLSDAIIQAKAQAMSYCQSVFKYDRWNCSLLLNRKTKNNIFKHVYRETAFVHALFGASISHSVARACAAGTMVKCMCAREKSGEDTRRIWKRGGCSDDIQYGKKVTRSFLEMKLAGEDYIGEVLKHDTVIGLKTVDSQMREVCKCHGFSGSCTMKTCWRRTGSFNSTMTILKRHYHHAVRKKIFNYASKRATNRKMHIDRNQLIFLHKSPNFCFSTSGRQCSDPSNCATLCCGRGFTRKSFKAEERCRCQWVDCCYVKCDKCLIEKVEFYCK